MIYTFAIADHQGTPTLYLNNTAQTPTWRQYTPYGAPRGTTATYPDNRGFLNKPMSPTGLTIIGARTYDPAIGRFISVDPVIDTADPQQWNPYAYGHNSPIHWSDPSGMKDCGNDSCTIYTTPTPDGGKIVHGPGGEKTKVGGGKGSGRIKPTKTRKPYPSCFAVRDLPCTRGGLGGRNLHNTAAFYAEYLVDLGSKLDLDPRGLLATLMIESRFCLGVTGNRLCAIQHGIQKDVNVPGWVPILGGQGDEASIGISNMDKKTFDSVRDAFPEEFAGTSWGDIRDAPELALKAMAYRMKALERDLPEVAGSGAQYSRPELLDFGYRGTVGAMRDVALGRDQMSQHGKDHLEMFRSNFTEADKVICGSGYWTCG